MAYDEKLAVRFRRLIDGEPGVTEKRMMGGVCFFVNGHMVGGADCTKGGGQRFMFRVGKENDSAAAALAGGEPMIQGGRRMSGMYFVDVGKYSEHALKDWLALALVHARSLPAK